MDHLDRLEAQSIFILREAYKKLGKLGMLWSKAKDPTVLLWLAKRLSMVTAHFLLFM